MCIGIEIARLADRELDSPVGQIDAGGLLAGLPEQLHTWRGGHQSASYKSGLARELDNLASLCPRLTPLFKELAHKEGYANSKKSGVRS